MTGERRQIKILQQQKLQNFFSFRKTYKEAEVLKDHTNFVSAVCVFNNGKWLATASNDKTICLYIFGSTQPFVTLKEVSFCVV